MSYYRSKQVVWFIVQITRQTVCKHTVRQVIQKPKTRFTSINPQREKGFISYLPFCLFYQLGFVIKLTEAFLIFNVRFLGIVGNGYRTFFQVGGKLLQSFFELDVVLHLAFTVFTLHLCNLENSCTNIFCVHTYCAKQYYGQSRHHSFVFIICLNLILLLHNI